MKLGLSRFQPLTLSLGACSYMVQPVQTRELVRHFSGQRPERSSAEVVSALLDELKLTVQQQHLLAQTWLQYKLALEETLRERASCSAELVQLATDRHVVSEATALFLQVRYVVPTRSALVHSWYPLLCADVTSLLAESSLGCAYC